jgi:hypothetical protein
MDTTDYPSLPRLARMHARLAADSRRVEQIVDGQMDVIERLFHASTAENWLEVARATQILSQLPAEKLTPDIITAAKSVYGELASFGNGFQKPKHLAKLLAACREVRSRT